MTVFTDKVTKYLPRLMNDLDIDRIQAAGIFGNIGTETGGFTAMQEKSPVVKGSRGGYGWLQWTGPRRIKYEAWAKSKGLDPALDETNYQYLVLETKTDEAHSLVQLKKTSTLEASTETFMEQNLRPGVPNLKSRIGYAHQAFDAASAVTKTDNKTATAIVIGTVAAGTGAVITSNPTITTHPTHTWMWLIAGAAALIGIVWWIIHEYHAGETDQAKA